MVKISDKHTDKSKIIAKVSSRIIRNVSDSGH